MTALDLAGDLPIAVRRLERRPAGEAGDKPGDSPYNPTKTERTKGKSVQGQPLEAESDALAELLEASGGGDRAAFKRVYELTASRLYPIALRLLRRPELAEEVLQESYVLIWRKAAQFDAGRGRPLPWMATIVRNRSIDQLRSLMRVQEDPVPWDETVEDLADPLAAAATLSSADSLAIRGCLGGLKEQQRNAILLAYYYGLTYEELAERMSCPVGTAKSWVRRGLQQMRACLEA